MHNQSNVIALPSQAQSHPLPLIAIERPPEPTGGDRMKITLDMDATLAATLLGGLSPFLGAIQAYQDSRTEFEKRKEGEKRRKEVMHQTREACRRKALYELMKWTIRERPRYDIYCKAAIFEVPGIFGPTEHRVFTCDKDRWRLYHRLKCRDMLRKRAEGCTFAKIGPRWGVAGGSASKAVKDFQGTPEGERLTCRLSLT